MSEEYLENLSNYWLTFYEDANLINAAMNGVAEVIKNYYFRVLQKQLPLPLQEFPVFREEFWNLIEIQADQGELINRQGIEYFRYPLDETYAKIPMLYNIIYRPTVILKDGLDYKIVRETTNNDNVDVDGLLQENELLIDSYIWFKRKTPVSGNPFNGDPFTHNDIAKRVDSNGQLYISFYAPKSYIDSQDLFKEYGALVKFKDKSSEEYKAFLTGLYRLYIKGPTIANMNAGLTLAAGYPIAKMTEVITTVEIYEDSSKEINEFILTTSEGNIYTIPRFKLNEFDESVSPPVLKDIILPTLSLSGVEGNPDFSDPLLPAGVYNVNFVINRTDSFITDLKVVDNNTEPRWWKIKRGKLSSSFAAGIDEALLKDPAVQDYLFDTYLKYNTFGVFIDFRVLRNDIRVLGDFIEILQDIKPTSKAFLIYESDIRVITVMTAGDTYHGNIENPTLPDYQNNNGVGLSYQFFIEELRQIVHEISMGLPFDYKPDQYEAIPLQIGMSLETVGHAYMATGLTVTISGNTAGEGPSSRFNIRDGRPLVIGSGTSTPDTPLELGCWYADQVWENVSLQTIIAPIPDIPSIASDALGVYVEIPFLPEGDYDTFIIYKNGVPIGMTHETFYKDYLADPPYTDEYRIVAMYKGFMSALSDPATAPVVLTPSVFLEMLEGLGASLSDVSGNANNATIENYSDADDPVVLLTLSENTGTSLTDSSLNSNDGSVVNDSNIIPNLFGVQFNLAENTGTVLNDASLNNNDGNIINDSNIIPNLLSVQFNLTEGSGTTLDDVSVNNNDGIIVP